MRNVDTLFAGSEALLLLLLRRYGEIVSAATSLVLTTDYPSLYQLLLSLLPAIDLNNDQLLMTN